MLKCSSVLAVGWPEPLSAESNRRAESVRRLVSAEVSNGLADIPPFPAQSVKPMESL